MDPPSAKANPISYKGSTSVTTFLWKEKKLCNGIFQQEREVTLQTPSSVKKGGEQVLRELDERFPCNLWRRTWWGELSLCSPWRSMVEQLSTCSLWRTPLWSRWMPKGGCDTMRDPRWISLFLKDCTLWEGLTLEKFVKNSLPWDGPHAGAGEECKSPPAEGVIEWLWWAPGVQPG